MTHLLDASAVLAWLLDERGAGRVDDLIVGASIGAANWSEVLQKVRSRERDAAEVGRLLRALGVEVIDVSASDAELAAELWSRDRPLSLGDRLCLAAAARRGLVAVTADAAWRRAAPGVEVLVIR